MTKPELHSLAEKIYLRYYYRKLLVLPAVVIPLGVLGTIPRTSPHRDYYFWGIMVVEYALFVFVMKSAAKKLKADCHEFGARCPKCGEALFSSLSNIRRVAAVGRCPHCRCIIYDDVVA